MNRNCYSIFFLQLMNAIGLPGGSAPVGGQYSTLYKKANAHSDSIWAVAWKRQVANKSIVHDVIVSGGVDDCVKVSMHSETRMMYLELQVDRRRVEFVNEKHEGKVWYSKLFENLKNLIYNPMLF